MANLPLSIQRQLENQHQGPFVRYNIKPRYACWAVGIMVIGNLYGV